MNGYDKQRKSVTSFDLFISNVRRGYDDGLSRARMKKKKNEKTRVTLRVNWIHINNFEFADNPANLIFARNCRSLVKQDRVEFSLSAFPAAETIEVAMLLLFKTVEKDRKSREEKGPRVSMRLQNGGGIDRWSIWSSIETSILIYRSVVLEDWLLFFSLFFLFLKTFLT